MAAAVRIRQALVVECWLLTRQLEARSLVKTCSRHTSCIAWPQARADEACAASDAAPSQHPTAEGADRQHGTSQQGTCPQVSQTSIPPCFHDVEHEML